MVAPADTASLFTAAEFNKLVRAGGFGDTRVELRRGLIRKLNAQYAPHARTKRLLAKAIEAAIESAGLGWIVDQEVSVALGEAFEPLPDIVVWDSNAAPRDLDGPIPAEAVRLIVEVSDTSLGDDLGDKLADYAGSGVAEYWVADVKGRLILQHVTPRANIYARREPRRFGEAFASLAYDALRIDTATLLDAR